MEWYKMTPADTLYFRGAEPMNIGENHTASLVFPPPARTLSGALRTAVLVQNGISFGAFGNGDAPEKISHAIGKAGEAAPFQVTGPLFMINDTPYVPAPFSWFGEKDNTGEKQIVVKTLPIRSRLIKTEDPELLWAASNKSEMVSLGGKWISCKDLNSGEPAVGLKTVESFFENEPRTGIALEKNRTARKGHLYTFNHTRLKKEVTLLFGTDQPLPLKVKGVLKLGAEQRFGWYEKISEKQVGINFTGKGKCYISLSIVKGSPETNASVIASGKILYLGGWDLKKGFHKPMEGFFPAGTVFNKKINNNCIALEEV